MDKRMEESMQYLKKKQIETIEENNRTFGHDSHLQQNDK